MAIEHGHETLVRGMVGQVISIHSKNLDPGAVVLISWNRYRPMVEWWMTEVAMVSWAAVELDGAKLGDA